jgi:hypothetical protein
VGAKTRFFRKIVIPAVERLIKASTAGRDRKVIKMVKFVGPPFGHVCYPDEGSFEFRVLSFE